MGLARGGQHGPWIALLSHACGLLAAVSVLGIPFAGRLLWPGIAYGTLKLVAVAVAPKSCGCPLDQNAPRARRTDAIVLLVQKHRKAMLMRALAQLHANFNNCFRKDVLLFHNGDFEGPDQAEVIKMFPLVQFHYLEAGGKYWRIPPALEKYDGPWRFTKGYTEGYRHMCRFHYKMVFEYLEERGYEYFMRMDDDSFIMSCIEYDLFKFMEDRNISYAWRLAQLEYRDFADHLPELVDTYVRERRMPVSHELSSHYDGGKLSTASWDRWTYYTNFMMTRTSWWRSPPVAAWIDRVDSSGIAYVHRVGDAPIQTFTRMMFMPKENVHHFQDWTYFHGPLIAVSLRSILPERWASFFLDGNQEVEWVGGLYDFDDAPDFSPIVRKINFFLRNVLKLQV